jgi:hypothetical protein
LYIGQFSFFKICEADFSSRYYYLFQITYYPQHISPFLYNNFNHLIFLTNLPAGLCGVRLTKEQPGSYYNPCKEPDPVAHMNYSENLQKDLENFVGETVTVYTVSGGRAGSGFTGMILYVNSSYVRILMKMERRPGRTGNTGSSGRRNSNAAGRGVTADIPLDKIACFVHNTK